MIRHAIAFVVLLGLLLLGPAIGHSSAKVCIPELGCIRGTTMKGYLTDKFEAFMGVPFAQPPVGDLRFAAPQPVRPWQGELNATAPRPDCMQKNYLLPVPVVSGDEDCLYLNIYRPLKTDKKLPVMVYIYGGGFFSGTASPLIHGPEYFMDSKEVILVTVAYRLGALGFLSTGDLEMPGNFGFKDQHMALKWVQKYISLFGGNPKNVTIFGQSAGGVSVHLHMLSDLSKGLFKGAIVMSGNAAAPFAEPVENPLEQARKQAELCGIPDSGELTTEELTNALRKVDANQLVESGDGFKKWSVDPLTTFRPVIEPPSPNAFLTRNPKDIIANGKYSKVPWMTGFVPNEGAVRALAILVNDTQRNEFNADFDSMVEMLMELPPGEKMDEKIKNITDFYFGGTHELNNNTAQGLVDSITDRGFFRPFYQNLEQYVQNANLKQGPVYLYKFNYRGAVSYSSVYTGNLNNYGVVHCDDLIYLFRSPLLFGADFDKSSMDAKVVQELVSIYVSFAKNGQPKRSKDMKKCNKETLLRKNRICDYQEIRNKGDDFEVTINSGFDKSALTLWNRILK